MSHSNPTTDSTMVRVAKFTVKGVGLLLVFGTIIFFLWRVFSSNNPKDLEKLTPNKPLHDAYMAAEAEGGGLSVLTQYQKDFITSDVEKNYGYFAVTDTKFIPGANQVQVLFRYNNSTIRHLVEDYALTETPGRDERLYDVTLYIIYDLTPEDTSDNSVEHPDAIKAVRYHASSETKATQNLYNFRKLVFDGVDLDSPMLVIYADFYYVGDLDYEKEAYGSLPLYFHDLAWDDYDLSKSEREDIENFGS